MREEGLRVKKPRRFQKTTDSRHKLKIAPNIVERRFGEFAPSPNCLWVSDLTYVWTKEGWLYLCVFIDAYFRTIVGWSAEAHMEASMVCESFKMGLRSRHVKHGSLIVHTDRGSQYASKEFRALLQMKGASLSMSRAGDCWDNSMAESFWATIKGELLERSVWQTRAQARDAIKEWIDNFYNRYRRHSSIGYKSPIDYEVLTRESKIA